VAKIVTRAELFHFVQEHGGGQRVLAWLAGRQLSVVTFDQLRVAGLGRHAIARRLADGSLHRRHRGVYVVGSPIPLPGATQLAALFACGAGSLVSHRSAAALWGLAHDGDEVQVTVVGRHRRSRAGIDVTQVGSLDQRDRRSRNGILVTAPARTLIDLAGVVDDDADLERAVSEARALRLIRDGEIEAALERARNRAGATRMRRFLSAETESGFTRLEAERRMWRLARDSGLPQPLCNARVNGVEVDFVWPEQRLIVEVDGYQFHGHRRAFERDRRRDQALIAAGYRVMRVTWRQLRWEPLRVAVAIAGALAVDAGSFAAGARPMADGVQTAAEASRKHG